MSVCHVCVCVYCVCVCCAHEQCIHVAVITDKRPVGVYVCVNYYSHCVYM